MTEEITLDELRKTAEQGGLKLSEDELQRLLPGVNRSRQQVAELRNLLSAGVEPAAIFRVTKREE